MFESCFDALDRQALALYSIAVIWASAMVFALYYKYRNKHVTWQKRDSGQQVVYGHD
jgi:hypothetical protein